jgi:hypothetical protein
VAEWRPEARRFEPRVRLPQAADKPSQSCHRESILGFPLQQLLEHGARVEPILVSKGLLVLPGFAPAGEVLLFRQKDPKPLMPYPASFG